MKLIAQTPIMHDGVRVESGEAFDVKNDKQAKALIANGAAIGPKATKSETEPTAPEQPAA